MANQACGGRTTRPGGGLGTMHDDVEVEIIDDAGAMPAPGHRIVAVDALPRTGFGKLRRGAVAGLLGSARR